MARKRDKDASLSDKFSSLIHTKPTFYDDDDEDLTKIDEVAPNEGNSDCSADELDLVQFRKLNIEFLDAEDNKYSGRRSSRVEQEKAFDSDSSDVEGSTDENLDHTHSGKDFESEDERSFEGSDYDDDGGGGGDGNDDTSSDSDQETSGVPDSGGEALQSNIPVLNEEILHKTTEDIKKGNAIRNQLLIWDLLLECRMKFQKCLSSSNQLPSFQNLKKFTSSGGKELEDLLSTSQESLKHLLNSFLELQDALLKNNEDFKRCTPKHKMSSDEEDCGEGGSSDKTGRRQKKRIKISDFSNELGERHKKMETFQNETIQKWNDKTRIAHLNSKNFNAFEQSTLKQIEHVLLDKPRLIKRTQVKRSNYHILGQSDVSEEAPPEKQIRMDETENASVDTLHKKVEKKIYKEIFDDDDFYHQLLSEYIKRKSFNVSDPVELSKQWIQLEKIRSKMKKKVDARATKGRKIRYVVHQKLVNFMMPIENVVYNEGSRAELFNSIFGMNKIS